MDTYVILSKLSAEAFRDPKDFPKLAEQVSAKIKEQCPKVVWKDSYATMGRFSAEETNTAGFFSYSISQFSGAMPGARNTVALEVPVLAEEAVERTRLVEHGQVVEAALGALGVGELRITRCARRRADPVGDAVGRQRIVIPRDRRAVRH